MHSARAPQALYPTAFFHYRPKRYLVILSPVEEFAHALNSYICKTYEAGVENGKPFTSIEYVQGQPFPHDLDPPALSVLVAGYQIPSYG